MRVKTVATVVTTDSAGNLVDAIAVREAAANETDSVGRPVDALGVEEDSSGIPVRIVAGKTAQDSAGNLVETLPVDYAGEAAAPLQVVATRGEINIAQGGATTSTNCKQVGRHRFFIGDQDVSELRICYPGWWVSDTLGEQNMESASYRIAGTCEIGGVVRRQKFDGENNGTVNSGDHWVEGIVLPSDFGLEKFDAGTEFWIKSEREVAVGQKCMFHQTASYSVPITGETYYVGGTGATSQLDNAGALGTSGGWAVQAHVWLPLMVLGRPISGNMMAVACMGDSQINGDGGGSGDGRGATGGGIYRRGLLDTARVHLARSSETTGGLNNSCAHRLAVLPYVNHVELQTGGNSYSAGTAVGTALAAVDSVRDKIKTTNPAVYVTQYQLIKKTDGTWTSVAGQTPRAGFGAWSATWDAATAAAVGDNLDEYMSFAPGVYTDPTLTDRFKANFTTDGTHLNVTGQAAQQPIVNAHFAALKAAYV